MAIKMKGIFRGLKIISQMFIHKEHEMEIGYPTDVKHVAHIGLGTSDTSPSWMNEFKVTEESRSLSTAGQSRQTSWASADFEQPRGMLPIDIFQDNKSGQDTPSCPDVPRGPRKAKRKKNKASPTSSTRSSSSRSRASFATAYDDFSESQRGFRVA
ncbi:CRIB domain-containing protein RIC10-like [Phragmites australis]|uniref:CRIB domain-containing protein RIC10-like n=1 Tax=Phragmites australis TaxID=29695 RepID=UPI002D799A14|nr:CRIB domain-containing protein RIC10-like [Phragmites australis]